MIVWAWILRASVRLQWDDQPLQSNRGDGETENLRGEETGVGKVAENKKGSGGGQEVPKAFWLNFKDMIELAKAAES